MKQVGIICEYNPFHSGHAYQIEQIRVREPQATVVCLMSGHATQRGELAVADKMTRAAMALSCGADVVLELPYPYASASAAYFAGAGVAILDALGVDELSFGSECDDLSLLMRAASATENADFTARVHTRQRRGEGSAQAYFGELQAALGEENVRFLANDILALSYVRAIRSIDSTMRPVPLRRAGSAYHATEIETGLHPSAGALRALLCAGNIHEALSYVPENAKTYLKSAIERGIAPADPHRLDSAVLTFFRLHNPESLEYIGEMQGGLAHRLHAAALAQTTADAMLAAAASKSYPTARLRRAVLFAMTGVTAADLQTPPAYLSLLAANERGRVWLRTKKEDAPIPIVAKAADAAAISPAAARQFALSQALDALFTMTLPITLPADAPIKWPPYMGK